MAFNNGVPWSKNYLQLMKDDLTAVHIAKPNEEEIMTDTNISLDKLKPGDRVKFYREDEVTSVNTVTGFARTKSGARIRMTCGSGWEAVSNGICFRADRLEKPKKEFKAGQVWKDSERTYMMIGGVGGVKAYDTQDIMY